MPRYAYERLNHESASFLELETTRAFAHSATTLVFDAEPLRNEPGGVDIDTVRAGIAARLHQAPRFRQKLKQIPFENHPVWVDDHEFNLDYHLRHTSLPRPGRMDQLLSMSARIEAQRLDRSRPLWECWVLEGLESNRFAIILKTHHALVDPASHEELLHALLSPDPAPPAEDVPPYRPRPVPSVLELVADEIVRQARLPRRALERMRAFAGENHGLRHEVEARVRAVAHMLGYTIRPRLETPLNGRIGPHRRFDYLRVPLDEVRAIHRALGGSVHDVILAEVTGAVRTFLQERLVSPTTLDFRVGTAVSLPRKGDGPDVVAEWVIELPIWEADAATRLALVREQTDAWCKTDPALAARTLFSVAEWTSSRWLALGARAVSSRLPVNTTVVNVPGPQVPLYFLGARLLETYGQAALRADNALGVTAMSYDGQLFWGVNADFDLMPDLARFTAALERAHRELLQLTRPENGHLELVGRESSTRSG